MTTIEDSYTGIIQINGTYYVVEDGQIYYFDDQASED